jgi:hypothetical protein
MASPLVVLYEGSIWLGVFIVWRRNRKERRAERKRQDKPDTNGGSAPETEGRAESEMKQLPHDPVDPDEPFPPTRDPEETENTD